MLYIKKGKQPDSLIQYRKNKFAYFDGYQGKAEIRRNCWKNKDTSVHIVCAGLMRTI